MHKCWLVQIKTVNSESKMAISSKFGECGVIPASVDSDGVNPSGLDGDVQTVARQARTGVLPWIFFLVASAFYFYEFFARVAPVCSRVTFAV